MSGQGCKDPLEYFHPQNFFKPTSSEEDEVIESAKEAIDAADKEGLTPEIFAKYQDQLKKIIDASPNKIATASYLLELISERGFTRTHLAVLDGCVVVKTCGRGRPKRTREEMEKGDNGNQGSTVNKTVGEENGNGKKDKTENKEMREGGNGNQDSTANKTVGEENGNGKENETKKESVGRSSKFSALVKGGGICRVTGTPFPFLVSAHILPFSSRKGDNEKVKRYLELIRALFGPDALQRLVENVLNGGNGERNINRLDNGIPLQSMAHDMWDSMKFFLEVDWNTYNPSTKEVRRYPYS